MSDSRPSHGDPHASGSHYQPSLAVVFIIVILFIGATFLMVTTISSSPTTSTTTTLPSTTTTKASTTARVIKSRVQASRSRTVRPSLSSPPNTPRSSRLRTGTPCRPSMGRRKKKTIIYYKAGQLKAAQEVATTIKVSQSAVQPIGTLTTVSGASGDDIVVILGKDESA